MSDTETSDVVEHREFGGVPTSSRRTRLGDGREQIVITIADIDPVAIDALEAAEQALAAAARDWYGRVPGLETVVDVAIACGRPDGAGGWAACDQLDTRARVQLSATLVSALPRPT